MKKLKCGGDEREEGEKWSKIVAATVKRRKFHRGIR